MDRRKFLRYTAGTLATSVVLDGYGARAFDVQQSALIQSLSHLAGANDRILVLIQLNGGNDGLNTVIPLDQMSRYVSLRSNIAIPESKVLTLDKNPTTGLHPAMTGLQRLYNDGKLSIVHSVSYPSPNFSHFRSSDIWFTGADSDKLLTTGWAGRYLDERYPGYPEKYPNQQNPDPLAIQIGAVASTALLGPAQTMAITLQNPDTFAQLVGEKPNVNSDLNLETPAGRHIAFIRQQQQTSVGYAAQIKAAASKGKNQVTYPTGNTLADQLKIVARLIHGGLQTKLYYVSLGGFDTHASQVSATDPTSGAHANLMRYVSDGIKTFMDDVKAMGAEDRVVGMTFSEFGRRAVSNSSLGTDHGVAAPLFIFGSAVKRQVVGKNPDLNDLSNNNIKMQTDFRQVYAALLGDWLGEGETVLTEVLSRDFERVPVFKEYITATDPISQSFRIFPNPATENVILEAEELSDVRSVNLIDQLGRSHQPRAVNRLAEKTLGMYVGNLPSGTYLVNIETPHKRLIGRLLVAH